MLEARLRLAHANATKRYNEERAERRRKQALGLATTVGRKETQAAKQAQVLAQRIVAL